MSGFWQGFVLGWAIDASILAFVCFAWALTLRAQLRSARGSHAADIKVFLAKLGDAIKRAEAVSQ